MDDINDDIKRRKKIRKTLLLKINDEIKNISNSKPPLLINSKTIEEFENIYNTNNILLSEKGILYTNFIKMETIIYPPIPAPSRRIKSVEKKIEKTKIKKDLKGLSFDEEIISPLNFLPKKIDLASKKLTNVNKRYTKTVEIPKSIENNLNRDKSISKVEDQLNQSTKFEDNNMLHQLIEKILRIKNNENMEKIIKRNIKKLRKYCYKFRKKKNKKKNNKSQEHKHNIHIHATTSKNLNAKFNENEKERKLSNFKNIPHSSSKKQKNLLSLKNRRNPIKLKTLNEEDGNNVLITLKKMKIIKKSTKAIENLNSNINEFSGSNDNNEAVPSINNIKRELMRSTINKKPSKYYIHDTDKIKPKFKKKIVMRNTSLFYGKEIEKLNFSLKKNNIHLFKSNKKVKKLEIKLDNKNNTLMDQISPKIKKNNFSKRKSKKKLIESPQNKNDFYSNCNTNYNTNIFTITQSTHDKTNKILKKKSHA